MPVNSTDITTRILVDNKQGIAEYKKFEQQTLTSNKNIEKSSEQTQKSLHSNLATSKKGFAQVSSVMGQAGIATGAFGGVVGGLLTVLSAGTLGVGLLVLGISALVAILSSIATASQRAREELNELNKEIKSLSQTIEEESKVLEDAKGREDDYTKALASRIELERQLKDVLKKKAGLKLKEFEIKDQADLNKLIKQETLLEEQLKDNKKIFFQSGRGLVELTKEDAKNTKNQIIRTLELTAEEKKQREQSLLSVKEKRIRLQLEKDLLAEQSKGIDIVEKVKKGTEIAEKAFMLDSARNKELAALEDQRNIDKNKKLDEYNDAIKQMALEEVELEVNKNKAIEDSFNQMEEKRIQKLEERKQKEMEVSRSIAGEFANLGVEILKASKNAETFGEKVKMAFENALEKLLELIIQTIIFKSIMALLNFIPGAGTLISGITSLFMNKGGYVPGYARGGNVDSVPAMLTPGEFVVNKASAQMNPVSTNMINQGLNMDKIISGIGSIMENGINGSKGQNINIGMAITSKDLVGKTIIPVADKIGKTQINRNFRLIK